LAIRFAGKTTFTKTLYLLYKSIIVQLCHVYSLNKEYETLKKNKEKMNSILFQILLKIESLYSEQKIFILIDGLEEIERIDELAEGIVVNFPENTKIIYTVNQDSTIFEELKRVYMYQTNYYLITDLKYSTGINLIKTWLSGIKRNLTDKQWQLVESLLLKAKLNLLLIYLIFLIISKWSSFYKIESRFLTCINVDDCFDYILDSMEKRHDRMIFSRCLFYLTIFQFGIQDCEMEEIMNIDREIRRYLRLDEQRNKNLKFPIALWIRIRSDLEDFLTVKQFDYVQINSWTNISFKEIVEARYVNGYDNDKFDVLLTNIIYYFIRIQHEEKLCFKTETGRYKFNKRLIRCLPFFIFRLKEPNYKANALKKYIYYNCEFVYAAAYINDRLFIERAPDIWSLFLLFEKEKQKVEYERKLTEPVLELSIISYGYQRNFYEMFQDPDRISEILTNDQKVNFNENHLEILKLIENFKSFKMFE
jgi:hypothetical protein